MANPIGDVQNLINSFIGMNIPIVLIPVSCASSDINKNNIEDLTSIITNKAQCRYYSSSSSSSSDYDYYNKRDYQKKIKNSPRRSYKLTSKIAKAISPSFGKYIIVFKNNISIDNLHIKLTALETNPKFKLKHKLTHTIKGCTATLDTDTYTSLLTDTDIQYIEKDIIYTDMIINKNIQSTMNNGNIPFWDQLITNTQLSTNDNFSNVNCYVVDTGIMANHNEFYPNQVLMNYNAINKSINAQDDNGHGTAIASIIGGNTTGIAARTTLHAVKVLDSTGSGYVSDIIGGLDWIVQNKRNNSIINMSIGGSYSKALDTVLELMISLNIPIVCAAGNSGIDASHSSPACSIGVYAISAYDNMKNKPMWANTGPVIKTFAPGVDVIAAWNSNISDYYLVSGTSISCSIATGIIIRYLNINTNATLLQINTYLNKSEVQNEILNIGNTNTPNNRIVFNQSNII